MHSILKGSLISIFMLTVPTGYAQEINSQELMLEHNSQEGENDLAYDFFTGTLQLIAPVQANPDQGGKQPVPQLQLNRCDLGQNQYVLIESQDHTVQQFSQHYNKQLQAAETESHKIQATVIGAYEEKDGKNYLRVKSIEDVKTDTSCHLMDMFP
ncbi:hypothetical protein [Alkanindiges illinoisensis]|uniref:hypothetical protein n=1 Tax=Alkanindiges illinoisensis TaxID=197183 RepID=UPI0012EC92ED|nr:hypothetical protein [Alkanindiges illinoisensis]